MTHHGPSTGSLEPRSPEEPPCSQGPEQHRVSLKDGPAGGFIHPELRAGPRGGNQEPTCPRPRGIQLLAGVCLHVLRPLEAELFRIRERNLELEKEALACPGYLWVPGSAFVLQSSAHESWPGREQCPSVTCTGNWKLETEGLPYSTSDSCLNKPNTRPDLCSLHVGQARPACSFLSPPGPGLLKAQLLGRFLCERILQVQINAVDAAHAFFFFLLSSTKRILKFFFLFKFSSIIFINAERWNIWQNYFK